MKYLQKTLFLVLVLLVSFPAHALVDGGVETLRQTGKAFTAVARAVSPSVVNIQVEKKVTGPAIGQLQIPFGGGEFPFNDDFFKRFFGDAFPGLPEMRKQPNLPEMPQKSVGQGSGFVFQSKDSLLADKTYIMTNNHVVEGAEKIRVKFQNGREFEAKITGTDPQSDVAVIEIKAGGLKPLPLGDSSKLEVGEWVVAIGNPFGLSHTLTVGVVSAKGRTALGINDYEDFIQTDAAINPGNSGGPLVNLDGKAIGMNTAIFSRTGGYMGVGFAIPINLAKNIAQQLIEHGEVTRGFLGVIIQQLTPDLARAFGIEETRGILVSQVNEDTPAEKAGLKVGDVIIAYRGKPVTDVGDFRNQVSLTPPGSTETLTILRDGKRMTLDVTIGKLSKDKVAAAGPAQSSEELGLTVQTLTPQLAEQFGLKSGEGVVITEVKPGSIAALGGLKPGTVIVEVDRKPVKTAAEFRRLVKESSQDKNILLLIRDNNAQSYVVLNW